MTPLFLILCAPIFVQAKVTGLGSDYNDNDKAITDEVIRNFIVDNRISSIEEFLSLLPTSYRSRYVLVHTSKSIQGASYQYPRVLLTGRGDFYKNNDYNTQSDAVISFNGHPSQFGHKSLEIMQYKEKERRFEFSEISFEGGSARISDPNPRQCMTCHDRGNANDPHPIWSDYPRWPGIYGAEDGHIKKGTRIDEEFRAFIARKAQHKRYKYLVGNGDIDYNSSKGELKGKPTLDVKGGYWISRYMREGASFLSLKLGQQNDLRIKRMIQEHSQFKKYSQLFECVANSNAIEEEIEFLSPNYLQSISDMEKENFDLTQLKVREEDEFKGGKRRGFDHARSVGTKTGAYAWLASTFLNINPASWSITLNSPALGFTSPLGVTYGNINFSSRKGAHTLSTKECKDTLQNSMKNKVYTIPKNIQDGWKNFISEGDAKINVPQVAFVCTSCHLDANRHNIPFTRPKELKKYLSEAFIEDVEFRISPEAHDYGLGMPYRGGVLSEENRADLINYLRKVKGL